MTVLLRLVNIVFFCFYELSSKYTYMFRNVLGTTFLLLLIYHLFCRSMSEYFNPDENRRKSEERTGTISSNEKKLYVSCNCSNLNMNASL